MPSPPDPAFVPRRPPGGAGTVVVVRCACPGRSAGASRGRRLWPVLLPGASVAAPSRRESSAWGASRRLGTWNSSDAVTRRRAIRIDEAESGRWRVQDRSACSLPASTASSRDYVWSPKQRREPSRPERKSTRADRTCGLPLGPGAGCLRQSPSSPSRRSGSVDRVVLLVQLDSGR